MLKRFILFLAIAAMSTSSFADEGMWLPMLIGKNYEEMQRLGLELTPEQIYSVNNNSLKDAVVNFGGFCTGEIISGEGLILTNHHCGYDRIQSHSTAQNNYLDNGFWAKSKDQELPNEGLTVTFLIRMEDVTDQILGVTLGASDEAQRLQLIQGAIAEIEAGAVEGTHYTAEVKEFYEGNKYYLFVNEVFEDVRLVGAPPSSIGKFGGDTDNWMWPRHTGDFSLFRVYSGPDGNPAPYSPNNIPLKPRHFFPVSLEGIQKEDFTMVMGYPGSTERYLPSDGVKLLVEESNPARIKLRETRLEIMKKYMDENEEIRLMYSPKYFQVSNYYKYFIGQNQGIKNLDVIHQKEQQEQDFLAWAKANNKTDQYGDLFKQYEQVYQDYKKVNEPYVYLEEGAFGIDILLLAYHFEGIGEILKAVEENRKEVDPERVKTLMDPLVAELREKVDQHFTDYYAPIDKEVFAALLKMYHENVDKAYHPPIFKEVEKKYKGDFSRFADVVFKKSMFTDKSKVMSFLENPQQKALANDPAFRTMKSILSHFREAAGQEFQSSRLALSNLHRDYQRGLLQMNGDSAMYPDANFSQRLTYGTVDGYVARDAVYYDYYTTLEGLMEKEDPISEEFTVSEKLKELYNNKDFGPYANEKGEMPVCFITNNDITGGNSGSPVLNGKGQLIGTAFDGNWEAMSGDIEFAENLQRCIVTDIRYVLFIIDKYAEADNLIEEMTIVEAEKVSTQSEKAAGK